MRIDLKLKKSNQKISKFLTKNILKILKFIGFVEEEDCFVFKNMKLQFLQDVLWILEKQKQELEVNRKVYDIENDPLYFISKTLKMMKKKLFLQLDINI